MNGSGPKWVQRFFFLAVAVACVTTITVVWSAWRDRPEHASRMIADISINLNGRPIREHCTSCHPAGASVLGDADTASHPDIAPHLTEKLGCTSCHLGEGMALDEEISHGLPGLGARKVLQGRELQASCYRCHELAPLPGAEKAWQGYRLFMTRACNTCHHIAGLGRGGGYGPDLSHLGSYLGLELIEDAIRNPTKDPPNSIMPRFPLSRGQAGNISYFLKSRVKNPNYATPMRVQAGLVHLPEVSPIPSGSKLSGGESLLYTKHCLACHKYRQRDGRIAPDLTYIGHIRDSAYLRDFLTRPTSRVPGAIMPRIVMSPDEEQTLIAFLLHQAVGPVHVSLAAEKKDPGFTPAAATALEVADKRMFMKLCQPCHAAGGDGLGPLQPNLANFPRAFAANAEFFRRIGADRLRQSIDQGVPGTSMPAYGRLLEPPARDRLLALIFRAFIGIEVSDKIALAPLPPRPTQTFGTADRDELFSGNCFRCHGVAGTGSGPESLRYRPQPRNLTNRPYFAYCNDERIARAIHDGIPGTAMPSFRGTLSAAELWSLVEKVRTLSGTDGQ